MTKPTGRKRIRFELNAEPDRAVYLAGSFNDWDPRKKRMRPVDRDGLYEATVVIPRGRHEYKFVVDGEWRADPENPEWSPDGMGSLNSVVKV